MERFEFRELCEGDVVVFKGRALSCGEEVSLKNKLAAIVGLSWNLGYCGKHKIFFRKYDAGRVDEIWICPKCFDERFRVRK